MNNRCILMSLTAFDEATAKVRCIDPKTQNMRDGASFHIAA